MRKSYSGAGFYADLCRNIQKYTEIYRNIQKAYDTRRHFLSANLGGCKEEIPNGRNKRTAEHGATDEKGGIISRAMNKTKHARMTCGRIETDAGRCNGWGRIDDGGGVLVGGFELVVDDGTEEGGELGITFAGAFERVKGSVCIGVRASGVGELGAETVFVFGKECAGFVDGVVVGDVAELAAAVFGGYGLLPLVGREEVKAGDEEDLRGTSAGFRPTVEVGEFGSLRRVLLVIARVLDGIGFLNAFTDDSTALVAVLLLTVDDLVLADGTVDLGERMGEGDFGHVTMMLFDPPRLAARRASGGGKPCGYRGLLYCSYGVGCLLTNE